jgi:hypothetical protein
VTCTSTATKCLSCTTPSPKLKDFTCVASCGASYFEVPGEICNPCPPGCTSCTSTDCTVCSPGFKKKNNICANPCGVGWYDAGVDCQPCASNCATCTGPATCSTCAAGFAQTPPSCPACSSPCLTCSTSPTTCASCSGTKFLSGTNCVDAVLCPAGTFPNNNLC